MDSERPLHWKQGLFLQPQHFQLLERSLRSLLAPYQDLAAAHFWGVAQMGINKAALGTGSFEIVQGDFLFPDGTFVSLPSNAVTVSRTFQSAWVEGGKPLTVYVGLRNWNSLGENVAVVERLEETTGVTSRCVSPADGEEVKDLHSGGPPGRVERLYYLIRVFYETERDQLGDYSLIPVGQLERMGDEILLSERFIPPALSVGTSQILLRILKEIRDQLSARGRQLEEYEEAEGNPDSRIRFPGHGLSPGPPITQPVHTTSLSRGGNETGPPVGRIWTAPSVGRGTQLFFREGRCAGPDRG